MARAEAIHAQIEDAHAKIFQASSESSMHPTSEKASEMLLDDAVAEAMEPLLTHEIVERELEMQEVAEIEERRDEELRVAKEEVERRLSVEDSAVEYQRELWCHHYYEYYNLEGGTEDEDEDDDTVDFSLGDAESTSGGMSPGQVIDISSYTSEA